MTLPIVALMSTDNLKKEISLNTYCTLVIQEVSAAENNRERAVSGGDEDRV